MIYEEKYGDVEMEIRKIVDDLMRSELELLQVIIFAYLLILFNQFAVFYPWGLLQRNLSKGHEGFGSRD